MKIGIERNGIRGGVVLFLGGVLLTWGTARLVSGGAPFGFSNFGEAAGSRDAVSVESPFFAEMIFARPFIEGDRVELTVPVQARTSRTCIEFYLKSDYYRPRSRAAREAFEFEVTVPGVNTMRYEIATSREAKLFRMGPLALQDEPAVNFTLIATASYQSESFQRASKVEVEALRSTDCEE